MPDRGQLLKDFYAKYAPNEELSKERLDAINKKYGNDDKSLLIDFYAKYAPQEELSNERFAAIDKKYGLSIKKKENTVPTASSGQVASTASKDDPNPFRIGVAHGDVLRQNDIVGQDGLVIPLDINHWAFGDNAEEKWNPKVTAHSTGGQGNYVTHPDILKKQGVPTSQWNTPSVKEITQKYKEKAKETSDAKKKMLGEQNIVQRLTTPVIESLVSGALGIGSSVVGAVGGLTSLIESNADDLKTGAIIMDNPALFFKEGNVKKPPVVPSKIVTNTLMNFAQKLNEASAGMTTVAKTSAGIRTPELSSVELLEKGDYSGFGKSLGVEFFKYMPQLLTAVATGSPYVSTGVMSAGGNLVDRYGQDGDIGGDDMAKSLAVGAVDAMIGKVLNLDIKLLQGMMGNPEAKTKFIRSFAQGLGLTGRGGFENSVEEGFISGFTTLVNKIGEGSFTEKEKQKAVLDFKNSLLVGFTTGGVISGASAIASYKPLSKDEKRKIEKYEEVIQSNAGVEAKKIAKAKITEIKDGVNKKAQDNYEKAINLPIEDRVAVIEASNLIKELDAELAMVDDVDIKNAIKENIGLLEGSIEATLNKNNEVTPETIPTEDAGAALGSSGLVVDNNGVDVVKDKGSVGVGLQIPKRADEKIKQSNIEIQEHEFERYVAENSEDTVELAEAYIRDLNKEVNKKDYKHQLIDEYGVKITERDFAQYGDINNVDFVISRRYFKKDARPLDTQLQELSLDSGVDITEQDFIDYLRQQQSDMNKTKEVTQKQRLKTRYSELFGGDLTPKLARKIVQDEIKLNAEKYEKFIEQESRDAAELEQQYYDAIKRGEIIVNDGEGGNNVKGDTEVQTGLSVGIVPKTQSPTTPTQSNSGGIGVSPVAAPPIIPPPPPNTHPAATSGTPNNKPTTPKEAADLSVQMIKEEVDAIMEASKISKKARSLFSIKKWVDRQSGIRKELKRVGAKVTEAFMTNVAGSRAFADKRFEVVEKKIYKDLSLDDEKLLDQLAFHNRVIQIDENFDNRRIDAETKIATLKADLATEKARLKTLPKITQKELQKSEGLKKAIKQQENNLKDRPLHPKGFNKEVSTLAIQGLKDMVGDAKFAEINKRLDDYFAEYNKLLEEQYSAGLLNKETYDRFKKDKYIPRRFLEHLLVDPSTKKVSPIAEKSLTKDQIKSIEGGSESLLFTDTRVLLNAAMRSSASRIAQNHANRALAETIASLDANNLPNNIGKAPNYSFSKGTIKTDAFGNKVVREADVGYTNIHYFNENGQWDAIQVKNELAKEWLDVEKQFDDFNPLLKSVLLNGVLKAFATGINPTFFITNVPVDFVNTILFTNVYDDTNIFNASRKLAIAFSRNAYNYSRLEAGKQVDAEWKKDYDEWVENGGMMQFLTDQGRPDDVAKRDAEIRNKKSFLPLNRLKKGVVNSLAFTGEASEKAMRLSVFNQVKKNLLEGKTPTDKEYKEILAQAAAASRKTMDFAQGGLFAKKADVFLPYLNAAIQGMRVSVEYVADNPKQIVRKLAEFSIPIAALMTYNLSVMDDEEEWNDIPPHEKENYFIILKPWKNDDGKRDYLRIKKHPSIQWFTNLIEHAVIGIRDSFSDKKVGKGDFLSSEWDALNNMLPIPLDLKKSLSKSPAVLQAAIAYVANFDLFRDEKISRDFGDITPVLEGKYEKNVPLFYKKFGEVTGASPKRTQAAVEKVVTNPGTNAVIGLSYSLLDNMVTVMTGKPKTGTESKYQGVSANGIKDLFTARLVRTIDPGYSGYKDTRAKDLALELKSKDKEIKHDIKAIIKSSTSDDNTKADLDKYIKGIPLAEAEKVRFKDYAKDQIKLKKATDSTPDSEFYLDLKYETDPRVKAFLVFDKFGNADIETRQKIVSNTKKFKYKLFGNDRFDAEYNSLIKEAKTFSKNK